MAYEVYIDGLMLPVTPSKFTFKVNGNNKTLNLINDGEVNLLKTPKLTDISFECLLPQSAYPFAVYPDGFKNAGYYITQFERLHTNKQPFHFKLIRNLPNGTHLYDADFKVSLEDYQFVDDAENYGFDIVVSVNLKQWRDYGTKEMEFYEETQHDGYGYNRAVMLSFLVKFHLFRSIIPPLL